MIAAMILAAGESSRMGHPKALLTYRGATFLRGILDACYAAGIERRVVVLGYDADKILQSNNLKDVIVTRSENLAAGPIASIRAGLGVLADHPVQGVLVWSVDRPHVSSATIELLIDAFRSSRQPIVIPTHRDRRGHPVIFGQAVFAELLEAPDDPGARAVVRRDPARIHAVAVSDPAVLEDLNTPDEYRRLVQGEDRFRE